MAAILLMVGRGLEQPGVVQRMLDVQATPQKPQYNMAPEVRDLISAAHGGQASRNRSPLARPASSPGSFRHVCPAVGIVGLLKMSWGS